MTIEKMCLCGNGTFRSTDSYFKICSRCGRPWDGTCLDTEKNTIHFKGEGYSILNNQIND